MSTCSMARVVLGLVCLFINVSRSVVVKSSKTCNVMDYGAHGDGSHDDTKAIQAAIDDCNVGSVLSLPRTRSNVQTSYNGLVLLPKDKSFLSFPLLISDASHIAIQIDSGAELLISDDINSWPSDTHFLTLNKVSYYGILGPGTINGQGQKWWDKDPSFRPHTVQTDKHSSDGFVYNLNIENPPGHVLELYSADTELSHVTIKSPLSSPNTDAVDVHGNNMYIHDCYFDTGDDNVAVHANNTLVENCKFGTGHGASIGSIGGGWYRNITFRNLIMDGTTNGCRIKTDSGATMGKVWDVYYQNITMSNVKNSIVVTQYYPDNKKETSYLYIKSIFFTDITSVDSTHAGVFNCQPSTPCHNIQMKNVQISSNGQSSSFDFECENAYGTATNVSPKACIK